MTEKRWEKLYLVAFVIIALFSVSLVFMDASAVPQVTNAPITLPVTTANGGTGATSIGTSLTNSGNVLNTIQDLRTTASPTFAAPTFTSLTVGGTSILPTLTATSTAIGGGVLLAGACSTGTVTVTGATTSMSAVASPNTYPGDGVVWDAQVTSSNTVTIKVCAIVGLTPSSSTYNVRVVQ